MSVLPTDVVINTETVSPAGTPSPDKDPDAQAKHSLQVRQPIPAELCLELWPSNSPSSALSSAQGSLHNVGTLRTAAHPKETLTHAGLSMGLTWEMLA